MNSSVLIESPYERDHCKIGIIHIGIGAFHRAHQAVFVDDLLAINHQSNWGIVGINLRVEDSDLIKQLKKQNHRYILKTISDTGSKHYRKIGSILDLSLIHI